jgi:hypothetical protein
MADKRKVSVLAVPVGQEPEVRLLNNDLESLQEFVGGQICAQGIARRLWLYANDDGLRLGLPYNRCGFVGDLVIAKVSSATRGATPTASASPKPTLESSITKASGSAG